MDDLVARIEAAFAARAHPGDTEITRCTYDRVNGGTMDGPCWECVEMAEFFAGRSWRGVRGCGFVVMETPTRSLPSRLTATTYLLT